MKRYVGACILVILSTVFLRSQPKLAIDNMTIDLGTIYSGQVKTGTIMLRNIGTQPLKILRVQPSCGCTAVRQPKSELQPNESDEVEVSFNSSMYRGPVEKYVNIETNDPLSQYVAVKLTAMVKEELAPTTSSYSIWLGDITVGKKVEEPLTFANLSGRTIAIRSITSTSPSIVARTAQKTVGPSDTLTVALSAVAGKIGYETSSLTIETDSKNQPNVELRVYFIGAEAKK